MIKVINSAQVNRQYSIKPSIFHYFFFKVVVTYGSSPKQSQTFSDGLLANHYIQRTLSVNNERFRATIKFLKIKTGYVFIREAEVQASACPSPGERGFVLILVFNYPRKCKNKIYYFLISQHWDGKVVEILHTGKPGRPILHTQYYGC